MMKTIRRDRILQDMKEFQQEFGGRYGILSSGLFGSLARDAASEDSDIDMAVRLKEPNLVTFSRIRPVLRKGLNFVMNRSFSLVCNLLVHSFRTSCSGGPAYEPLLQPPSYEILKG
ncbi:MAG: uncharacterized protein PWQ29_132 [Verrucomicrobiota bacterium]|jgi:predicted nucleotidyltransferase|nr:uncharacterized protein [Verrucomicrobiota bacterium]MDK2962738.1 uncharacterized protein [Verrucomicrobiota bacterium]